MALQQTISLEKNRAKIGCEVEVIVDDYGELPGDLIGAHQSRRAPASTAR